MTKKIAISLPDELVARAHAAVNAGTAASVSAYVADSMRRRAASESLSDLVRDLVAEHGAPTRADRATARRVLYGGGAAKSNESKQQPRRRRAV